MTADNQNEVLGSLTARLEELSHCPDNQFDAFQAADAIEEAVGGSLASKTKRAAIIDFTTQDIDHLETVVAKFNKNPPEAKDDQDLELYIDLIDEARQIIEVRREQIVKETALGGREARIKAELKGQRARQEELFVATSQNGLNAAGDVDKKRRRSAA